MAKETSPDLIILDLAMPEMDGFESTREISKLMPRVPILLHTLYWSPRVVIEALKAGARRAIPKSQSNAVIAAVQELLPAPEPRLIVLLHKPQAKVVTPQQSPTDSAQEPAFTTMADNSIAGPQIALSPKIAYSQEKDAHDASESEGTPRMNAKDLNAPNLEDRDNDDQDLDEEARKVS